MQTEKIKVSNLMCSGCANTIKNELLKQAEINNIEVDIQNKTVTFSYDNIEKQFILELLDSIGYPEQKD